MPDPIKTTTDLVPSYSRFLEMHKALLGDKFDVPSDPKEAYSDLNNDVVRKGLWESMKSNNFDVPNDFDQFSTDLGFVKKKDNSQSLGTGSQSKESDLLKYPEVDGIGTFKGFTPEQKQKLAKDALQRNDIVQVDTKGKPVKLGNSIGNYLINENAPKPIGDYYAAKGIKPETIGLPADIPLDYPISKDLRDEYDQRLKKHDDFLLSPSRLDSELEVTPNDDPHTVQLKQFAQQAKVNRDAGFVSKYFFGTAKDIVEGVHSNVVTPLMGISNIISDVLTYNGVKLPEVLDNKNVDKALSYIPIIGELWNNYDAMKRTQPDLPKNVAGTVIGGAAQLPGMTLGLMAAPEIKAGKLGLTLAGYVGAESGLNTYNELSKQGVQIGQKLKESGKAATEGAIQGLLMEGIMASGANKSFLTSKVIGAVGFGGLDMFSQYAQNGYIDPKVAVGNALFGGLLTGNGKYEAKGVNLIPEFIGKKFDNWLRTTPQEAKLISKIETPTEELRAKSDEFVEKAISKEDVKVEQNEDGTHNVSVNFDVEKATDEQKHSLGIGGLLNDITDVKDVDKAILENPAQWKDEIAKDLSNGIISQQQHDFILNKINETVANHDPINIQSEPIVAEINKLNKQIEDVNAMPIDPLVKEIKIGLINDQIKVEKQKISDIITGEKPTEVKTEKPIGKPVTVYHGTLQKFDEFDSSKAGSNTKAKSAGEGFFFSTNKEVATSYASESNVKYDQLHKDAELAKKELMDITGDTPQGFTSSKNKGFKMEYGKTPKEISENNAKFKDIFDRITNFEDYKSTFENEPSLTDNTLAKSGQLKEVTLDMKNPLVYDYKGEPYRDKTFYDIIKQAKEDGHDSVIFKNTYDPGNRSTKNTLTDVHVVFDKSQIKPIENPPSINPKPEQNGSQKTNAQKTDAEEAKVLIPDVVTGDKPVTTSIIDEINSKPLTHAEGLGMGSNEMEGTYISTEKNNRYSKDAKQVKADVKNPYVLKDSNELIDLQNSVLDKAKAEYIKANPEAKEIESAKSFDDDVFINYPDFQDYVAKEVTKKLKSEGYDSAYLRETKDSEGMLVVFDKSKVGGIETPEQTKLSQEQETETLLSGTAEQNRKTGTYTKDGVTYTRQEPQEGIKGSSGKVEFTNQESIPFEYKLVEAETLQPSHQGGIRNPNHFVPEMQPKNRNDKGSIAAEFSFANHPRGEKLGESTDAYSGAPIVNERNEVVQGNNRSSGLKMGYDVGNKEYRQWLHDNAEKFGLTKEQIDGMKSPILTREIKVSDEKGIELGNYDAKDLETGGKRRVNPIATTARMPFTKMGEIAELLFKDATKTLNESIRSNSKKVFDLINPYLSSSERTSMVKDGELTQSGVEDIEAIVKHFLYKNGDIDLPDMYEGLSFVQKEGIRRSLPKLLSADLKNSLIPDLQNAIIAVNDFIKSGFDNFQGWKNKIDMWTNNIPADVYTPLELKLAEVIGEAKTQADITKVISEFTELIKGKEADIFEPKVNPITKEEAVKKLFNIEPNENARKETKNVTEINEKSKPSTDQVSGTTGSAKEPEKPIQSKEDEIKQRIADRLGRLSQIKELTGGEKPDVLADIFGLVKDLAELGEIKLEQGIKHIIEKLKETMSPALVDKYQKEIEQEFEKTSGIKKALVREETINSTDWEKVSDTEMHKMGKDLIDAGKVDPKKIIGEIIETPRALQPEEVVALIAHKVDIDTRFDNVYKRLAEDPTNPSVKAEAKALETELLEYEQMSLITAQQQSLAFRLRRGLLNRQYDLVPQLNKIRANNNGVLPKETEKLFKETYDKLKEVTDQIKELEQKLKESEEKLAEKNILEETERENKKLSISEKGKKLAAEIRKGKINRPDVFQMATPGSLIWDGAIESVARAVELGTGLAEAVAKELKKIKNTDWYKSHAKQKDIEKAFLGHFKIEEPKKPSIEKGKIVIPKSVLKQLISEGKTTIEEWTTEIHKQFTEDGIQVSETQVRDAITGYGKTTNLTKDQVELEILKQKNIGRLISSLEDIIIKKQNPKKTGAQRRELDEKERQLQKQVRELMKDLPQTDTDIQNKWKSLLGKRKKALENDIEALDRQIKEGKRDIKQKKGVAYDEETVTLTAIRDEKKKLLDEIDPVERKGISDEELVNRTITKLNKDIAQLESDIQSGNLEKAKKIARKVPDSEEIFEKRKRLEVLKETIGDMRKEAGIIEKEKLAKQKSFATKKINELKERLNTQNFAKGRYDKDGKFIPTVKETKPVDDELRKLNGEKLRLQETFDKEQYKFELQNATKGQKLKNILLEVFTLPRLIAGIDLSATMIQGLIRTTTRPGQASKAFVEMFKQLGSEKRYEKFMSEFKATDLYLKIKASGGYLSEPSSKFSAREELFQSGWVNHIWDWGIDKTIGRIGDKTSEVGKNLNPYKAGQRAFEGYLNTMRIQAYEEYFGLLEKNGMTIENNLADYQAFSSMINNFTGRGKLIGKLDHASDVLTLALFSPRKMAANLNVLNPRFYYKMYQRSPIAAKKAMINMAQFVGVMATTFALANMAGKVAGQDDTVNFDPTSSKFLKIKANGKWIDILAGHSQILTMFTRVVSQRYTKSPGIVKTLGSARDVPTTKDVIQRFVESKASPQFGIALRWLGGHVDDSGKRTDPFGEDLTLKSELMRNTVPIWMQGMDEVMKSGDPMANYGLMALSVFGSNVTVDKTLENRDKKLLNKIQNPKKPLTPEELDMKVSDRLKESIMEYYQTDKINGIKVDDMTLDELRNEASKMGEEKMKHVQELLKK